MLNRNENKTKWPGASRYWKIDEMIGKTHCKNTRKDFNWRPLLAGVSRKFFSGLIWEGIRLQHFGHFKSNILERIPCRDSTVISHPRRKQSCIFGPHKKVFKKYLENWFDNLTFILDCNLRYCAFYGYRGTWEIHKIMIACNANAANK